jgi:hypothetical protein
MENVGLRGELLLDVERRYESIEANSTRGKDNDS